MRLSEFFRKAESKKIVINSDIDGFLSGMLLQNYYDCEIVGFTNSKESIWLTPDITSILTPIYVDIFVNTPQTYCIDQHIIAYDNAHLNKLLAYGTKLNPNIDVNRRTFSGDLGKSADYFHKYPFGTVHYLLALMKLDGIDVEINDLTSNKEVRCENSRTYNVCPAQLIMRADDALYSSLGPYIDNTKIWWELLRKYRSNIIEELIKYKDSCDPYRNDEYKNYLKDFFIDGLGCDGPDGAFNTVSDYDNKLQNRIIQYRQMICQIMGMNVELPKELIEYRGQAYRGYYSANSLNRAFTYAFVRSPNKQNHFSYTIDIH